MEFPDGFPFWERERTQFLPNGRYEGWRCKVEGPSFPDAPNVWIIYLYTLGEKWPHSRGNVSKYSLHGAYGFGFPAKNFSQVIQKCLFFLNPRSLEVTNNL